jgi:hypothetical protein
MKYYILGITPHRPTFPHLLCRYTDDQSLADLQEKAPDNPQGEFMLGSFRGTLPSGQDGYEALPFDALEDAEAKITAEQSAKSTFTYALWAA